MIVSVAVKDPGQPCDSREIMDRIIDEMVEFTWQSTHAEAASRILKSIEPNERIQITVRDPQGKLMGIAVCVGEDDDHVGLVLGVQWRFVLPEARGSVGVAIQREILKVARMVGVTIIAYTKRISEGRFEINYQKLKERTNGQEDLEGR